MWTLSIGDWEDTMNVPPTEGIPLSREHRQGLEEIAEELDVPVPWR